MASFYGGKPSIPFVIKATFNTLEEMTQAFSQGKDYTDVGYGEYAMIKNIDPNDWYGGQVYQRTYDGYESVGSFRGPQGTSMNFRGTYSSRDTYYLDKNQIDVVYYQGSSYIRSGSETEIRDVEPGSPCQNYWVLLAKKGEKGEQGEKGESGESGSGSSDGLEQILLTNENLDNLKPDKFTAYYAQEGNTVTSGPTSSSMGFVLFAYKTSQNYRVQDYIGLEGRERKTRYCTHSLTDENTIDDNGFNWGTNGKALCKDKAYYIIWRDTSTNRFYICTSASKINAQNTYSEVNGSIHVYNGSTNKFDPYGSTYRPSNKNYYGLLYSNQGNLVFSSGFVPPAYGNADEIINSDTGWSEWKYMSEGGEGEQGPTGPAGQSWITEIDPNGDGTYTLVVRTENSVSGPSGGPTA